MENNGSPVVRAVGHLVAIQGQLTENTATRETLQVSDTAGGRGGGRVGGGRGGGEGGGGWPCPVLASE